MSIADDIEILVLSRVVIDPSASLIVVDPSLSDGWPPIFCPMGLVDSHGEPWFGPNVPFPVIVGIVINSHRTRDTVLCAVTVKHENLLVEVPLAAILRVVRPDDDMPEAAGPASIHQVSMRIFELCKAEVPIIPPEHPTLASLEINALPRDVRKAFAVPDAVEILWHHRNAVFVWAERGPNGWSVYRNIFGSITYWSGPNLSPPALHGACVDPTYDMFRLINNILVGEASVDPDALDGPGRLIILGEDHRAPRQEAAWDESFLWMALPWRTKHF
jgi:hypothetical protein